MKRERKPFVFTLEDCDCKYCLYYGGRKNRKDICLAPDCVCKDEIEIAKRLAAQKEAENRGSEN